jgi:aerobic-type carbon monoxide dehydrogenase small subunit (CoxS/CutS family)
VTTKSPFENRPPEAPHEAKDGGFLVPCSLHVNGERVHAEVDRTMPLDLLLRRKLGLKSVLHGCESGSCGSCRVLVDGAVVSSCTHAAASLAPNASVETAESMQENERMRTVLRAFVRERSTRCALCLSGLAVMAVHLERAGQSFDEGAVDDLLAGAHCACTGRGSLRRALLTRD